MNLLREIQQAKPIIKSAIDCLAAHLSTLDKAEAVLLKGNQPSSRATARRSNKAAIMQDIEKALLSVLEFEKQNLKICSKDY